MCSPVTVLSLINTLASRQRSWESLVPASIKTPFPTCTVTPTAHGKALAQTGKKGTQVPNVWAGIASSAALPCRTRPGHRTLLRSFHCPHPLTLPCPNTRVRPPPPSASSSSSYCVPSNEIPVAEWNSSRPRFSVTRPRAIKYSGLISATAAVALRRSALYFPPSLSTNPLPPCTNVLVSPSCALSLLSYPRMPRSHGSFTAVSKHTLSLSLAICCIRVSVRLCTIGISIYRRVHTCTQGVRYKLHVRISESHNTLYVYIV